MSMIGAIPTGGNTPLEHNRDVTTPTGNKDLPDGPADDGHATIADSAGAAPKMPRGSGPATVSAHAFAIDGTSADIGAAGGLALQMGSVADQDATAPAQAADNIVALDTKDHLEPSPLMKALYPGLVPAKPSQLKDRNGASATPPNHEGEALKVEDEKKNVFLLVRHAGQLWRAPFQKDSVWIESMDEKDKDKEEEKKEDENKNEDEKKEEDGRGEEG